MLTTLLRREEYPERSLYVASGLVVALTLGLIPFLSLSAEDDRNLILLGILGMVYAVAMIRAQARFGVTRLALLNMLVSTLFISLGYMILSRASSTFWILYFVLPLISATIYYSERRTYLSGAISTFGFLAVVGVGAVRVPSTEVSLGVGSLVVFSLIAGRLGAVSEERLRLLREERTRREELASLYDLSSRLADAALDLDYVLNLVVRNAVETIRVTFARLALLQDGELVVRAAHPIRVLDRDLVVGQQEAANLLPYCQGVLAGDQPVVLSVGRIEVGKGESIFLGLDFVKSLCLVPLRTGKQPLGLLMLGEARQEEREPFTAEKMQLARSIGEQAASALERVEFFEQLEDSYFQTVLALSNAVEAKDTYTADHAQRLAEMAVAVGREMGLGAAELEDLRYGAILHDIGKIGIPDGILLKPGPLTAEEWAVMRTHPVIGAQILAPVPRLAGAAEIVRSHHEQFDGNGYPDGLAGERILLTARILAVVDAYSAMLDKRPYRDPLPQAEALAELRRKAGTQFDPQVVEVFLSLLPQDLGPVTS